MIAEIQFGGELRLLRAYVSKNGWDPEAQILKVNNIDGKFNKNNQIKGSIGNYKSSIDSTYSFDFEEPLLPGASKELIIFPQLDVAGQEDLPFFSLCL